MQTVSFNVSNADSDLIAKIVDRVVGVEALHLHPRDRRDRMSITMDITATHASGNPLRLADLLAADDFNFAHDVFGIANHLNRTTGQLENHFSPRFSRRQSEAA
jgi:hypothetical protein